MNLIDIEPFYLPSNNFTALIIGSSGAGKTRLLIDYIENHQSLVKEKVIFLFCYNLNKPENINPHFDTTVIYHKGLPSIRDIDSLKEQYINQRLEIIIDDCLTLLSNADAEIVHDYTLLISEISRRSCRLFFLAQTVFGKSTLFDLLRRNSSYTVYMSFLNDMSSINLLSTRQLGKSNFKDIYISKVNKPGSYLVVDNNIHVKGDDISLKLRKVRNFLWLPRFVNEKEKKSCKILKLFEIK